MMTTYSSARQLIQAVVHRYRSLSTYSDHGVVRRRLRRGDYQIAFETSFEREGLFRFVFDRPHPYKPLRHKVTRHILGRVDGVSSLETIRPGGEARREIEESFDMAVAGATGISGGAAHTIASLLVPDVTGWSLLDLKRPRLRAPRQVDGVWCHRITGLRHREPLSLYVGMDDLMVRCIEERKGSTQQWRLRVLAQP